MSSWAKSLIKLSTYEVETRQKRLAEIRDRRTQAEMRLAMLHAEGEAETAHAGRDPAAMGSLMAYLEALKARKHGVESEIMTIILEERGARDALAQAFEEQKKYEQIAEQQRLAEIKEEGRRETAALDELGLRKAAR
jgi:flagellar FliJ protein